MPLAAPTRAAAWPWALLGAGLLAAGALGLAWTTQQRLKALEAELVKRQQDSGSQAVEARTLAKQADAAARDAAARVALLDARVAETSLQRTQLEELIQSLSRSRDENVLADVDAALRVALQQTAITGSAEPLVTALKTADERLARYNQPRLERVRRAVVQDLDRTRSAAVADIGVLTLRLDEVIRSVDDLPLVTEPERRPSSRTATAAVARAPAAAASAAVAPAAWSEWLAKGQGWWQQLWAEVRGLVRVTRLSQGDAALLAPEQAWFVRENLKLRLLNARLALMARQFDTAQADLREVQALMERYFERDHRRVASARELVQQCATQARQVAVPRPDATLAAIATAVAGR